MEEVLEAVADNVATIVLALSQTDRVFGNIVPAAELIKVSPPRPTSSHPFFEFFFSC
jgi:hypothetical protein